MNIGKPVAVIHIEPIRLPVPDRVVVAAKPAVAPTGGSSGSAT